MKEIKRNEYLRHAWIEKHGWDPIETVSERQKMFFGAILCLVACIISFFILMIEQGVLGLFLLIGTVSIGTACVLRVVTLASRWAEFTNAVEQVRQMLAAGGIERERFYRMTGEHLRELATTTLRAQVTAVMDRLSEVADPFSSRFTKLVVERAELLVNLDRLAIFKLADSEHIEFYLPPPQEAK